MCSPSDRLRIEVLTLLNGVSWPTASVLLHVGHADRDPILDFRALWSLGVEGLPNQYTFPIWWSYVQVCRELAASAAVSMRTLDRALWQFSKEHQGLDRSDRFTWHRGGIELTKG